MIDACYSGTFFEQGKNIGEIQQGVLSFDPTIIRRAQTQKSRLAITAADRDSQTDDQHINTLHAPFALPFIRLLESEEFFGFRKLSDAIRGSEEMKKFDPMGGAFSGNEIGSDFFFIPLKK